MPKEQPTYSELKSKLDDVLMTLQNEDLDVDEALKAYELGMELVKQLEKVLETAENKVTKLKKKFDA